MPPSMSVPAGSISAGAVKVMPKSLSGSVSVSVGWSPSVLSAPGLSEIP